MNISQAKDNLLDQGIDTQTIDWESYSKDIPIEEWLSNEYGIELVDNFQLQSQMIKEQQAYKKSTVIHDNLKISKLFNKPKIIGLVGNANEAKSNLIYWMLDELRKEYKFKVYVYGLRCPVPNTIHVYSVEEIEQVKDSIIIIDEMESLLDFTDRKIKKQTEKTIRLLFHNNNILLLCGLGNNFKKFVSAKLSAIIFKKTTIADLINGSVVKNVIMKYEGEEKGSNVLSLALNEALIYDGLHYHKLQIPYMKNYDTKIDNVQILVRRSVPNKIVNKNGGKK